MKRVLLIWCRSNPVGHAPCGRRNSRPTSGVISGCYMRSNGNLRVLDRSTSRPSADRTSWTLQSSHAEASFTPAAAYVICVTAAQ